MRLYLMFLIIGSIFSSYLHADIVTKELNYNHNNTVMKGLLAFDDSIEGSRPGVLVVHEWWGHNAYARKRAIMLAESGYIALAIDMYGDGKTAGHPKDASKFSKAVAGNLPVAKERFMAAMNTLKQQKSVNPEKIAAIGYCFGGGIVLQMARQGIDLDGVVSFHGSLTSSIPVYKGSIKSKVLVFNGEADSFVKAEHIDAFKTEMEAADVDYQFVNFIGAKHSFTNPAADSFGEKFNLPLAYDKKADEASWQAMHQFFDTLFNE